jgi:hypothetical protein
MESEHADHLRTLEERLLQPDVRRSARTIASLLADEFVEFGSSGRVFDRPQIIAALRDEPPIERVLSDFRSTVLAPGVVLVTYRIARRTAADESSQHLLRSSIWKLIDGRWQMVFHQGTLSPTPPLIVPVDPVASDADAD